MHTGTELSPGDLFGGRYEVGSSLGAGGMGSVYEVHDRVTQRRRALKVMHRRGVDEEGFRTRFRREATVAASIDSEHVADVLDAGIDAPTQTPFIVMERLEGCDLAARLKARGALPAAEALLYLRQVAWGLDMAHRAGVIHRDLKPGNVFITQRDDGSPWVKILDFGIARRIDATTTTGSPGLVGTPVYAAPEQFHGREPSGPATDVFGVGMVAYTMLVGEPYWAPEQETAESVYALMYRLGEGPEEPPSARAGARRDIHLPPAFDRWFARATASAPAARYPSVGEAVEALAAAFGQSHRAPAPVYGARPKPADTTARPVARPTTTAPAPAPGRVRRRRWVGAFGAVVTLVGATVVTLRIGATATAPVDDPLAAMNVASPPTLGLEALAAYVSRRSDQEANLRSSTHWRSVRADFERVAGSVGVPPRWSAGREFARGQAELREGRPADALEAFTRASARDAAWALPWAGRAEAYLWQGEHERALEAAQRAERLDPEWPFAPALVGIVLAHQGREGDAIAAYKRGLTLAPDHPVLLAGLAIVYHGAHLDSEALRYAERALALDEDCVPAHLVLAERALERRDDDAALRHASRVVASVPDHISGLVALGDAHTRRGNQERAEAAYRKAVAAWEKKGRPNTASARFLALKHARGPSAAPTSRGSRSLRPASGPPSPSRPPETQPAPEARPASSPSSGPSPPPPPPPAAPSPSPPAPTAPPRPSRTRIPHNSGPERPQLIPGPSP
ncbi:MAG: protein kinase [Myxococcota bacterium]